MSQTEQGWGKVGRKGFGVFDCGEVRSPDDTSMYTAVYVSNVMTMKLAILLVGRQHWPQLKISYAENRCTANQTA